MGTYQILVLGNYKDSAMYHPLDGVEEKLKEIFAGTAELFCTDDTSKLLELKAGHFDGVISYLDIWDSVLSQEESEALEGFVKGGGGLLALHNGISIQGRENLKELVGAKFLTHPAQEEICFAPTAVSHPVVAGVESFSMVEEPYQFEFADVPYTLLLNYTYQGQIYPAGWCREVLDGRVVFLTPGHTAEKFKDPQYRRLILNSLRWCMRGISDN